MQLTVILGFVFLLLTASPVYAYIDPGTGSYFLQMALAGVFGSVFAIKVFWHQIVDFLKKIFGRKPSFQRKPSSQDAKSSKGSH